MGCCQASSIVKEMEVAINKDENLTQGPDLTIKSNINDDKEDIIIDEGTLFSDDVNEIITFRTHRNDIDPYNREQLFAAAQYVSKNAIHKLLERKKAEKRMLKLKTIEFDAEAMLQSAFLSKITDL
ncbi:unnamed protein product [Blepharisma stoltei]|uniref:Uncharacterized protein n=1 Tax=Blepharisma stoltei TaxID=1481888 RepID=A0AAU9JHL8_9CILI|nr:unnamed protein product [Blepharisma stoltei]